MNLNARWVRTLRAVVVTSLLVIALLGAVLGSIGHTGHLCKWLREPDHRQTPSMPGGPAVRTGVSAVPLHSPAS